MPAIEVTTVVLATAYHYFYFHGLYCNSGLPDLIDSLLYALTHKTLVFTFMILSTILSKEIIFPFAPRMFFKNRPLRGMCQ
jgi:hypothetical protein